MNKMHSNWVAAAVLCMGAVFCFGPGCSATAAGGSGGKDDQGGNGGAGGMDGTGGSMTSSSGNSSSGGGCGTAETCNGKDDNCNGLIDDDPVDAKGQCNTGKMGVCGVGKVACKGGAIACDETNTAKDEVCDNLDNDCDGEIDNGNPGGGDTCSTGQSGMCNAGFLTCVAGTYQCVPQVTPMAEVCGDNIDNNCNGMIDDGCPGAPCSHSPCDMGGPLAKDCSACVAVICNMDSDCCAAAWDAICVVRAIDYCGC